MKAFELLKLILDNPGAEIVVDGQPLVALKAPIAYADDSLYGLRSSIGDRCEEITLHVSPRDDRYAGADCCQKATRDETPGRDVFGYSQEDTRTVLHKGGPYTLEPAKVAAVLRYAYKFLTEPVDSIRTENIQGLVVVTNGATMVIDSDCNGVSSNVLFKTYVNGESQMPDILEVLANGEADRNAHALLRAAQAVQTSPAGEAQPMREDIQGEIDPRGIKANRQAPRNEVGD